MVVLAAQARAVLHLTLEVAVTVDGMQVAAFVSAKVGLAAAVRS